MVPQLLGKERDWDQSYYAEYSTKHQSQTHMRMFSDGKWKLIRDFNNTGRDELYYFVIDAAESNNFISLESDYTVKNQK